MESDSNDKLMEKPTEVSDNTDAAPNRKVRHKPATNKSIKEIMEDGKVPTEEVIGVLSKGTSLHKVRSLDKFYIRRYFVDLENMRIHYSPSLKGYLCREVPYIDLCDLTEVRKGWESDRFNVIESRFYRRPHASIGPKNLPALEKDNCFSLVFDNGTETEDFVAANHHVRDLWVKGLSYLIATCKNQQRENEYEFWLKQQFRKADKNNDRFLTFDEVLQILNQLNISMNKKHARALFDTVKTKHRLNLRSSEDGLNQEEFLKFYQLLNSRPELDKLFQQYSVNNTCIMGPEELMHFLKTEQKMSKVTYADCEALIKRYEPEECQVPGYMSIKGFRSLVMSVDFDIFNPRHRIVCMDMSQPLSHYFIASSHNTYLMMGQLTGNSSIEAYRLALIRGCRCIELDVWDGESLEEGPIIYHGYTLTTKILLRDVLKTIHKYAFRKSQFPLILSMENHCSLDFQRKMASLMVDILGDYLYKEPVDPNEKHFPSPEQLVRKILIKGKKLPIINRKFHRRLKRSLDIEIDITDESDEEEEEDKDIEENEVGFEDNRDSDDEMSETEEKPEITLRRHSNPEIFNTNIDPIDKNIRNLKAVPHIGSHQTLGMCTSTPVRSAEPESSDPNHSTKLKLAKEFSDLVTYCVAKKFVSFNDCFKKWKFYEMVSFDETKSENFSKSKETAADYVKFNKNHLSRIYPKATRTDSSNYNPISHWNMGSQLVALNYQTNDKPMLFNETLFALNGNCGYVLKSEYLRKGHQYGTSGRSSVVNAPTNKVKRVKMTIISGQHIPKSNNSLVGEIIDPYVKVKVYGHPADKFEYTTKPVKNNGFNPIWDENFEFTVRLPEMAFIYFAVKDQSKSGKNALLGQFMLAFQGIMEGYRTVRLVDQYNQPLIPASLLVNVTFKDIADYWSPD